MPKITDRVEVEVEITPFNMGRAFARMNSGEQAQFFDGVATEAATWEKAAGFQWVMMAQDLTEYPRGLAAFKEMAEYAEDATP